MKTYTYRITYISGQQTVVRDCDKPLDWDDVKPNGMLRFTTPTGSVAVNMGNVTAIDEIVNDIRLYDNGSNFQSGAESFAEEYVEPDNESEHINLNVITRQILENALARHGGNRHKVAQELGISDRTMYRRLKQYGLA